MNRILKPGFRVDEVKEWDIEATIDTLAAALRAADRRIRLGSEIQHEDGLSDFGWRLAIATDVYLAALEPVKAWLSEANTDQ